MSHATLRVATETLEKLLSFPKEWSITYVSWKPTNGWLEVTFHEDPKALVQLIPDRPEPPLVELIIRRFNDGMTQILGVRVIEEE